VIIAVGIANNNCSVDDKIVDGLIARLFGFV
jgi:hypothetical protein